MTMRRRLRSLLWRVPIEQEVHEELAHHVAMRTQELIDRGVDPAEARALARVRLENGKVEAVLKQLGRQRNESWARREWLDEFRQDLRFAWRQCVTRPGFTLAAVLTLGLGLGATTSIYSVIAWLVSQRTREIGVRMALGASKGDVIRMMSLHGLKPVVAGLAIGVAGASGATRLLQNQLFEVGPRDPMTLIATAALLLIVAAGAAMIPAWRATAIDPSSALRE